MPLDRRRFLVSVLSTILKERSTGSTRFYDNVPGRRGGWFHEYASPCADLGGCGRHNGAISIRRGRLRCTCATDQPSWYIVSTLDEAIAPDLERFFAKRMKATTTELKASHVSMLSQPKTVADVILDAAAKAQTASGTSTK